VDAGHDLILAADSTASEEIRNLASDLGVDFEPQGSAVLDTLGCLFQSKAVDASLIVSSQILASPAIFGETPITVTTPLPPTPHLSTSPAYVWKQPVKTDPKSMRAGYELRPHNGLTQLRKMSGGKGRVSCVSNTFNGII
jgi:hypothetical protein